ncbi:receptor-type guanylate cyclase gcy-28-like [Physella acuta]|uniref:receptor-type guanylate cyclase gcy-28-like n=1 Tax=Physella acuta TaxID=109671 RepID=UPI0027DD574E|nr:receptor-type guanylate cyclase gcy-28-like [Physella acuta]
MTSSSHVRPMSPTASRSQDGCQVQRSCIAETTGYLSRCSRTFSPTKTTTSANPVYDKPNPNPKKSGISHSITNFSQTTSTINPWIRKLLYAFFLSVFFQISHGNGADSTGLTFPSLIRIGVILPNNTASSSSLIKVQSSLESAKEKLERGVYKVNHVKKIKFDLRDSKCSALYGPLAAISMFKDKTVDVFFGPACDYSLSPVAKYASQRWRIPVVTVGGFAAAFDSKIEYPALTRIQTTSSDLKTVVRAILNHFEFKYFGMFYHDSGSALSDCYHTLFPLYKNMSESVTIQKFFNEENKDSLQNLLRDLKDFIEPNARIIVLCASPDSVREIMIKAHELNFDNGEYVFFNIDLFSSYNATARPWYRANDTQQRNDDARKAYESLMTVTLRKPTSEAYKNFSEEVKARAAKMYPNFTYGDQEVNSFVGAFHDAVILYALALNETIAEGKNVSDGLTITKKMWNRTFEGITGTVSIDANGDRNADYSLLDLDPETNTFEVVAEYFGNSKNYTPTPGKKIHWPGGRDGPPPDTPICGFDGSLCPPQKPFPEYGIVIIVLGSILLVVLIVTFFVYRHFKLEAELAEMNWRVRWDDIMFGGPTRNNKKTDSKNNQNGHGAILAIKPIPRAHISIQKPLLLEIKKVCSPNSPQ